MTQAHQPAVPMTTAHLLLRPLVMEDAPAIQRHFPHWEIVRFVNGRVPWPYPADGALTYLRDIALPAMARGEEWHWSIRLKERPDELIGAIALMAQEGNNRGFWLGRPWQGKGLMSEAAEAVTDFWFEALGNEILRVPKAAANHASRRVSERTGMRVIRQEMHAYVSGEHLTEVWEITRAEWRARKAPRPPPALSGCLGIRLTPSAQAPLAREAGEGGARTEGVGG